VNDSTVPTITTTSPPTSDDANIPDQDGDQSEDGASTLLTVVLPTSVGGIFALLGVAIAMATCFVSLRIVRKIKKNAMDGIKGMHVCPEHKNVSTEQNILSTDQYEVIPPRYDYVTVKVQPSSPLYAVADAEDCNGTCTATMGEEEEYYVNDNTTFHPNVKKSNSLSSDHEIDEIIVEENRAYDATAHLQPQADDGLYY